MEAKPAGWSSEYAAWFEYASVAAHYPLRPTYPPETIEVLVGLLDPESPAVLDAGCGPGDLARPLAEHVARVDAVDRSLAMLDVGRRLAGGTAPNLRWVQGTVESAGLAGPYGLIVCGDSIHWFDWSTVLPLFVGTLTSQGYLAIVQREWLNDPELRKRLGPIYARHGANPDFRPLDPVRELERRQLFERHGERVTRAVAWRPTPDEAVALHHSQCGFTRPKMRDPMAFDRELLDELTRAVPVGPDGRFDLTVQATVTWGRPGGRDE
jgi:SAM-dependent methyltransferase